jgi:hypothetical protein
MGGILMPFRQRYEVEFFQCEKTMATTTSMQKRAVGDGASRSPSGALGPLR